VFNTLYNTVLYHCIIQTHISIYICNIITILWRNYIKLCHPIDSLINWILFSYVIVLSIIAFFRLCGVYQNTKQVLDSIFVEYSISPSFHVVTKSYRRKTPHQTIIESRYSSFVFAVVRPFQADLRLRQRNTIIHPIHVHLRLDLKSHHTHQRPNSERQKLLREHLPSHVLVNNNHTIHFQL
jgi:hypothetical protein